MVLRKRRKVKLKAYCLFVTFIVWISVWIISTYETGENASIPDKISTIRRRIKMRMSDDIQSRVRVVSENNEEHDDDLNTLGDILLNGQEAVVNDGEIANNSDVDGRESIFESQEVTETDFLDSKGIEQEDKGIYAHKIDMVGNFRENSKENSVDCKKLMDGDVITLASARKIMKMRKRQAVSLKSYTWIVDCDAFKRTRGYILDVPSSIEQEFPLAFAIVAYRDVEQVERLLRAIYRPHNVYCLHIDVKSKQADIDAFNSISSCFDNVLLIRNPTNVTWGGFSVLEAEILCMKLLWQYKSWKYYINLTGQEFPLVTNLELVEILKAMKGANIADGTSLRGGNKDLFRWTLAGSRPPHNIRLVKGSIHVAVNRHFIHFCLHDKRSRDFQEWLKKTEIPDETLFASLNHNPHLGIPGSFLGSYEESPSKPIFIRYKRWQTDDEGSNTACRGKYVRGICVVGIGDLQELAKSHGLFVNKLYLEYEYLALDCLEEVIIQRTYDQYEAGETGIDISFYQNIDQVKYQVKERRHIHVQ